MNLPNISVLTFGCKYALNKAVGLSFTNKLGVFYNITSVNDSKCKLLEKLPSGKCTFLGDSTGQQL